ncbi:hypothetical protein D9M71_837650 [compost metagenome]
MLGVGVVQIGQCTVADVRWLTAPTVVDRPHAGICQGVVHRAEVARIGVGAEQETVVPVGVADMDLCVVRHAVHAETVAGGAHGADHVGAMGVVVGVERTVDVER